MAPAPSTTSRAAPLAFALVRSAAEDDTLAVAVDGRPTGAPAVPA